MQTVTLQIGSRQNVNLIMLFEIKSLLHFNSDICTNTRRIGLCIAIDCTVAINLKKNFFLYSQEKYR